MPVDLPFPRYEQRGQCRRCGRCCLNEDDCEHLVIRNGEATCLLFGCPERPVKCLNFPAGPPIMNELCGYSFFDLWEDRLLSSKEV